MKWPIATPRIMPIADFVRDRSDVCLADLGITTMPWHELTVQRIAENLRLRPADEFADTHDVTLADEAQRTYFKYGLLEFSPEVRDHIDREITRWARSFLAGGLWGMLLAGIGGVYLLLQFNGWKNTMRVCSRRVDELPRSRSPWCWVWPSLPSRPSCDIVTTPTHPDQILVDCIRRGDADAWERLIGQYEGRLLAYCESRLGRRSIAEDIVQDTFVGFITSLPNYDAQRSLEGYLFSICAYKLVDHLRREGRRPCAARFRRSAGTCRIPSRCPPASRRPAKMSAARNAVILRKVPGACLAGTAGTLAETRRLAKS